MKIKKILSSVIALVMLFALFSCNTDGNDNSGDDNGPYKTKKRYFYEYFDTAGAFYDYTVKNEKEFEKLADRVEAMLLEYHKLYDIYHEYDGITNLATINKTAGTGAKKVDRKIIDLLLFAKEMYEDTDGKVNAAFGAVLSIWHDYREAGVEVPPTETLTQAAQHTDFDSVIIDEKNSTVEILDPLVSLDVGAVGKGFAVEAVAKMLESEGKSGCVLDVGGNLRTIGKKPDGNGWTAGIINPDRMSVQSYVYTMTIFDSALVTSGSYERFYTVEGVNYHHIINPNTLMPENYYLSVSIKSDSSALSDALSTAIFNMTYDEAKSFVNSRAGIFVVLVMPDGEVRTLGNP